MTSLLPTYPTAHNTISSPEVDETPDERAYDALAEQEAGADARKDLYCSECCCTLGTGEAGRCSVCFARSQEGEW